MSVLKAHNYEELRKELQNLPMTWYPDLIRAMVLASLDKGAWAPIMGASRFVESIEKDWRRAHRSCPTCSTIQPSDKPLSLPPK